MAINHVILPQNKSYAIISVCSASILSVSPVLFLLAKDLPVGR